MLDELHDQLKNRLFNCQLRAVKQRHREDITRYYINVIVEDSMDDVNKSVDSPAIKTSSSDLMINSHVDTLGIV